MKESYINYAGFTPSEDSDVMIRLRVLAAEIFKERAHAEFILRQMFPSSAVGEYLEMHAAERGLSRKQATKAKGTVRFTPSEEEHGDIPIPRGTVVCSYNDMHRYVTDADAVIGSADSYVNVPITAVSAGADYNARGGVVTIIVTPVMGVGGVYNGSLIKGGSDTESDDELRERVIESYVEISNGTNAAYYKRIALSVSGVSSASVVGCARGAGTVDVYVLGDGEPVTSSQLAEVQRLLSEGRELNVDVRACQPSMAEVSLYILLKAQPGYDFNEVAARVQQEVTDYIDTLGLGRSVLLSEVGEVIYHIKGVAQYRFLESYGSDSIVPPSQYASVDYIVVREG